MQRQPHPAEDEHAPQVVRPGQLLYLLTVMTTISPPSNIRGSIDRLRHIDERMALAALLGCHIVICCISLALIAPQHYSFHIFYDPVQLPIAVAAVAAFAVVAWVFTAVPFSFGYLLGFYFYTVVLGYLWLNSYSDLNYDHRLGGLSAVVSWIAFAAPALLIRRPIKQRFSIPPAAFDHFLTLILAIAAAVVAISALYGYKVVPLEDIYDFREDLRLPFLLSYCIGITSNALLPFAFGCLMIRRNYLRAAAAIILLLLFYPITLAKLTFFAPLWLLAIAILSAVFTTRLAVVISLFAPMLAGVVLVTIFGKPALPFFDLVNFRMIGVPSNAIDVYNDFFFSHDLTYFCQIRILKYVMTCPYQEQLSLVMAKAYELGNYNASMFATEGIASVGTLLAPISLFACGLVIALANRLSAGLPPRLVLITGAVVPQVVLNVPLTTALLSHGAAMLFLLWYLTPRTIFEHEGAGLAAPGKPGEVITASR
jgi:hypothetical protein